MSVENLVDPRTGLIRSVFRHGRRPGNPGTFEAFTAVVSCISAGTTGVADAFAHGAALGSAEAARGAAIGEAVERYCGNVVPSRMLRSSYRALRTEGRPSVAPDRFALYSETQYRTPGFPFVPFTENLIVDWVPATDGYTGEPWLVPAPMIYLNPYRADAYPAGRRPTPITFMHFAGIAAGPSRAEAERSAIEELVERDAVTIWWHSGGPAGALDVEEFPELCALLVDPDTAEVQIRLLDIPSSFRIPVVGAFLEDREHQVVAFGSACRSTYLGAATKAVCEAFQVRALMIELADRDSPLWGAVDADRLSAHAYRPFRADRSYRQEFREDYRDITDLTHQAQLWLDPSIHDHHLDRLRNPVRRPRHAQERDAANLATDYTAHLTDHGFQVLSIDLATRDVAQAGLRVVRVVVPGMYGNAPAGFPFLGGTRLYTEPVALGLTSRRPREADLVRRPLPFA
jgi:ribosomal protein S12 methylthiotransferase accessory factor